MTRQASAAAGSADWHSTGLQVLLQELLELKGSLLQVESSQRKAIKGLPPKRRASAVNLAHYLAFRSADLRSLQIRLSRLGLSSLGRCETDVLANLDRVIGLLRRLLEPDGRAHDAAEAPPDAPPHDSGRQRLQQHAQDLFGRAPTHRQVRIMVTLPGEAARDPRLVETLVAGGMDIARINCAHDTPEDWSAMASEVRRAAGAAGRSVRILMDLAGPKLRTGPVGHGPALLQVKVQRNAAGEVTRPALLGLRPSGSTDPVSGAAACVGVDAAWLDVLRPGRPVRLVDARGSKRKLEVLERQAAGVLLACERSLHLASDTVLSCKATKGQDPVQTPVFDLPQATGALRLQRGDALWVHAGTMDNDAGEDDQQRAGPPPARIGCTLPQALRQARVGQSIWFDDGRLGGVIEVVAADGLQVRITQALDGGDKLMGDKGINLPDTDLDLPALTPKDLEDLETAVELADLIGLSFTQSAADVQALQAHLADRDAQHLGLVLKIETRRGFERLPEILMAAMASERAGVMIARGDLAVECGWERLAEVQEEMLWACEAAHMPVVWATQVLETLAKTGFPSRAEITDAAMGERAECVMLNKGEHIGDAMRTLDGILRRMQEHQDKKRPLLRALKAWGGVERATADRGGSAPVPASVAPALAPVDGVHHPPHRRQLDPHAHHGGQRDTGLEAEEADHASHHELEAVAGPSRRRRAGHAV